MERLLQRSGTASVVIIDDTDEIRFLVRLSLEAGGDFEVVGEADNGLEGIDVVARTQPDLVLLDLRMPVMSGLEALPRIKRACPSARVVVLSGFEADVMAEHALRRRGRRLRPEGDEHGRSRRVRERRARPVRPARPSRPPGLDPSPGTLTPATVAGLRS